MLKLQSELAFDCRMIRYLVAYHRLGQQSLKGPVSMVRPLARNWLTEVHDGTENVFAISEENDSVFQSYRSRVCFARLGLGKNKLFFFLFQPCCLFREVGQEEEGGNAYKSSHYPF